MVKHNILQKLGAAPDIKINKLGERVHDATGTGTGVFVWAETVRGAAIAGTANGAKGKPNQQVAEEASEMFASNIRCCAAVDEHLQDQLIIFMALAAGHSEMLAGPLTMHTQTAIYVCQQLLGVKFSVSMLPNGNCMVACNGVGWENKQI
ncbi:hypothetical protein RvY_15673 [Ramazzottius varieornatus]|uniref:RNA 3'-terminal phosphate cyclase n=1 Tax=Ramazzottius varieornatus TaxID=947166 RepID=A0A1D1VVS1_RAMVA|nr:hypothetical protein RvY_15673 [Ramazzottius varieornatus]